MLRTGLLPHTLRPAPWLPLVSLQESDKPAILSPKNGILSPKNKSAPVNALQNASLGQRRKSSDPSAPTGRRGSTRRGSVQSGRSSSRPKRRQSVTMSLEASLSAEEMEQLRKAAFDRADTNNDGMLEVGLRALTCL